MFSFNDLYMNMFYSPKKKIVKKKSSKAKNVSSSASSFAKNSKRKDLKQSKTESKKNQNKLTKNISSESSISIEELNAIYALPPKKFTMHMKVLYERDSAKFSKILENMYQRSEEEFCDILAAILLSDRKITIQEQYERLANDGQKLAYLGGIKKSIQKFISKLAKPVTKNLKETIMSKQYQCLDKLKEYCSDERYTELAWDAMIENPTESKTKFIDAVDNAKVDSNILQLVDAYATNKDYWGPDGAERLYNDVANLIEYTKEYSKSISEPKDIKGVSYVEISDAPKEMQESLIERKKKASKKMEVLKCIMKATETVMRAKLERDSAVLASMDHRGFDLSKQVDEVIRARRNQFDRNYGQIKNSFASKNMNIVNNKKGNSLS